MVHFDREADARDEAASCYNDAMPRDNEHNPDPNAARIVGESTADSTAMPAEIETAWAEWSSHIQNVDERGMELLRAAFEAGYSAAPESSPDCR